LSQLCSPFLLLPYFCAMLLFKAILIAILLVYVLVCGLVFIYRKLLHLSPFWCNVGMITFFVMTCHYFGVKAITILLLYASVCALTFIFRVLLLSTSKSANDYKTIYSALAEGNNFSYNKYNGYSNQLLSPEVIEGQQNKLLKFNGLLLCALVPLWLTYFFAYKTFNFLFRVGSSIYSKIFGMKNKITTIFKNIKAA
jgi:hypothetical protein